VACRKSVAEKVPEGLKFNSRCDLVCFENISSQHLENKYVFFCEEQNFIIRMSNYEYLDSGKPGKPGSQNPGQNTDYKTRVRTQITLI